MVTMPLMQEELELTAGDCKRLGNEISIKRLQACDPLLSSLTVYASPRSLSGNATKRRPSAQSGRFATGRHTAGREKEHKWVH